MKLSSKALALGLGLVGAIGMLVATILSMIGGTGATLSALSAAMPGYSPGGIVGLIVGAIWGFIYGAVGGWLLALFYNQFAPKAEAGGTTGT